MLKRMQQSQQSNPRLKHAYNRLEKKRLIDRSSGMPVATQRWHAALARATAHCVAMGVEVGDFRIPITMALITLYKNTLPEAELISSIEAMYLLQEEAYSTLMNLAQHQRKH